MRQGEDSIHPIDSLFGRRTIHHAMHFVRGDIYLKARRESPDPHCRSKAEPVLPAPIPQHRDPFGNTSDSSSLVAQIGSCKVGPCSEQPLSRQITQPRRNGRRAEAQSETVYQCICDESLLPFDRIESPFIRLGCHLPKAPNTGRRISEVSQQLVKTARILYAGCP